MSLEKPLLDEERGGAEKIKKLTPEQLDVFIHSKGIYNGLQVFAVLRRYGDKAEFQKHFEDWIENFSAEFHIATVAAFSSNPKLLNDFGRNTPTVADSVEKMLATVKNLEQELSESSNDLDPSELKSSLEHLLCSEPDLLIAYLRSLDQRPADHEKVLADIASRFGKHLSNQKPERN